MRNNNMVPEKRARTAAAGAESTTWDRLAVPFTRGPLDTSDAIPPRTGYYDKCIRPPGSEYYDGSTTPPPRAQTAAH